MTSYQRKQLEIELYRIIKVDCKHLSDDELVTRTAEVLRTTYYNFCTYQEKIDKILEDLKEGSTE